MPIAIHCGGCGKNMHVSSKHAGRKILCPDCKHPIHVQPDDTAYPAPKAVQPARRMNATPPAAIPSASAAPRNDASGMKFCRTCGNAVAEKAVACMGCGVPPNRGKAYCYHCGAQTRPEAVVCVQCGQGLGANLRNASEAVAGMASSWANAGMMAVARGGFDRQKKWIMVAAAAVVVSLFLPWTNVPMLGSISPYGLIQIESKIKDAMGKELSVVMEKSPFPHTAKAWTAFPPVWKKRIGVPAWTTLLCLYVP